MSPGPAIGSTCTVCQHADRALIDQEVLERKLSRRRIASLHGLQRDAVNRHAANHIAAPSEPVSVSESATPRQNVEAIVAHLAAKLRSGVIRVDELRELRLAELQLDQMSGGRSPEPRTAADVEGWDAMEAAMFEVLEPWPDARRALAEALRERCETAAARPGG
jgi:hypothetical protein